MDTPRYKDPDIPQTVTQDLIPDLLPYMGNPGLVVDTLRYIPYERGTSWKVGMGLFVFFLLVFAIWTGGWVMAVAVIVFTWVYLKTHNDPYDPVHARLLFTDLGLLYQGEFIPYPEIEHYFFVLDPDVVSFQFRFKRTGVMKKVIYLAEVQSIEAIKRYLQGKIKEHTEPERDTLNRLFRFLKL